MAIYIGAYFPDRQLDESLFSRALVKVAADLARLRQHPLQTSAPNLDLSFLIPAQHDKPDFDAMRFHSYDAKSNTLHMESSVPARMLDSLNAEAYVIAAMQDAVDNAIDFFTDRNSPFQRDEYVNLIENLSGAPVSRLAVN